MNAKMKRPDDHARLVAHALRAAAGAACGAAMLVSLPLAAQPWQAQAETYTTEAQVINSVPLRDRIRAPREECWTEDGRGAGDSRNNQAAGAVIGGIAGGLLGHQIGSGSGNTAATIAGTVGGAYAGNELGRRSGRDDRGAGQRCRVVEDFEERVVGYDVTYRFQGREFATRLPYDPGRTLPLSVTLAPAR